MSDNFDKPNQINNKQESPISVLNLHTAQKFYEKAIRISCEPDHEKSLRRIDEAIKLNPNNARFYYNKAKTLELIEDEQENDDYAIECYVKAIQLDPSNFDVHCDMGILLSEMGRDDEALKCYDEAIKLNPKHAYAYNQKGHSLAELEKYGEAIEYFDMALKINPEYDMAQCNKRMALEELESTGK